MRSALLNPFRMRHSNYSSNRLYTGRNASRPNVTSAEINTGRSALLRQLQENGAGWATQIVLGGKRKKCCLEI